MIVKKIMKHMEILENPDHPLLGPNLTGLYLFGLWQYGTKFRNFLFNVVHFCSLLFVATQFVELYYMRKDLPEAINNFSVTALSLVCISKTVSFITMHSKWTELVYLISAEEISAINKNELNTKTIMAEYKKYSRIVTYVYWVLLAVTSNITIITPALKYLLLSEYRKEIENGNEFYPQILSAWVPFNKNKMPGYLVVVVIHIWMISQGAGVVATYDTTAVTVMTFLKGQSRIIRDKCQRIFGEENPASDEDVFNRIKECHRHHNYLKDVYERVNTVLSPVMFLYVLVCSITICCSVVQLYLDIPTIQKMWVIEYAVTLTFQLFIYCWHSNEVALETDAIKCGIFESNWWRATVKQKKLLILLIGKVDQPYILTAGPFTSLSLATFIDILKGSYSFFTLFKQMQENRP